MVGEGVSAFLNPVRATDNIWASPDRLQPFHNDHDDEEDEDVGVDMEVNKLDGLSTRRVSMKRLYDEKADEDSS